MGGTYSTYGVEERRVRGFGGETRGQEIAWKTRRRLIDNFKMDLQEVGCGA